MVFLHYPEGWVSQEAEVCSPQDVESSSFGHSREVGQAITPVVHELLIIDVKKSGPRGNLHVRDTAGFEHPVYFSKSTFIVVYMFKDIERGDSVYAIARERAAAQIELQEGQVGHALSELKQRRQNKIGTYHGCTRQGMPDFS